MIDGMTMLSIIPCLSKADKGYLKRVSLYREFGEPFKVLHIEST